MCIRTRVYLNYRKTRNYLSKISRDQTFSNAIILNMSRMSLEKENYNTFIIKGDFTISKDDNNTWDQA